MLYKELGETPLECLGRFRVQNPEYQDEPMTYAGRLDPMAEGLLLVLAGDETKNKEKYLNLDKEYEFEVLLGFETDTGDLLGKILNSKSEILSNIEIPNLEKFIRKFKQPYPHFSSKTVAGKQLWQIARENGLDEIEIPQKEVEIYDLKFLGERRMLGEELRKEIMRRIDLVHGDFRQDEIKENWRHQFSKLKADSYQLIAFRVHCSSGTYVRSLAERIGESVGIPACAFSIKRIKVGDFEL